MRPPDSSDPAPRPPRRVRYPGRNPRRFSEKYKELQAEKYSGDVARIIASGKTPAGTHRSIMVAEVMEHLALKPGEVAVDCTLGFGGHAREILAAVQPGGRVIGMDVDPLELPRAEERLRALGFPPESLVIHAGNYAGLARVLPGLGFAEGVDAILADLGLSSMQIDNPARGFTFKEEGPLDLRMNPQRGIPASEWLQKRSELQLAAALRDNSDEPYADLLASAIHARRAEMSTTKLLARLVQETIHGFRPGVPREEIQTSVKRVIQALRIEVNDEFSALETFLRNLPLCLKPGGRAVILTFHSGEDRRVKKFLQAGRRDGIYAAISDGVVRATPEDQRENSRSSPAKLRWAVRGSGG